MKVIEQTEVPGEFIFYCPGCKCDHYFWCGDNHKISWHWNGSYEKPTVNPSIKVTLPVAEKKYCHFFIREGKIEYCGDSWHGFANKTVDMQDVDI